MEDGNQIGNQFDYLLQFYMMSAHETTNFKFPDYRTEYGILNLFRKSRAGFVLQKLLYFFNYLFFSKLSCL